MFSGQGVHGNGKKRGTLLISLYQCYSSHHVWRGNHLHWRDRAPCTTAVAWRYSRALGVAASTIEPAAKDLFQPETIVW